jgi:hypothetical protein
MEQMRLSIMREVLRLEGGNKTAAAKRLGLTRRTIQNYFPGGSADDGPASTPDAPPPGEPEQ